MNRRFSITLGGNNLLDHVTEWEDPMLFISKKNQSRIETIVGPGTDVDGNIRTNESIRIDGKVKGEVVAEAVVLGETGFIQGDISANKVTVAGRVKGNISSATILELLPKAQVNGD